MVGPILRFREAIPHTADVGIRASAPDLPTLFEEAALAVGDLAADTAVTAADAPGGAGEGIELEAPDLAGLAFGWLNEIVGLIDIHGPLARVEVASVDGERDEAWRLRGRAWLGGRGRIRLDIKSATYHGLAVERIPGGWRLTAYLDV